MCANSLSDVTPWDLVADGYEEEIVPVFEKWAKDSFDRVTPGVDDWVLDAACGPGTVAKLVAPMVRHVAALDFSSAMVEKLRSVIARDKITNITAQVCDCSSLPYRNNSFDITFSQFGLMFLPNRQTGFDEMFRVLKPGGRAAIYSWAPISESPAMTTMLGALHEAFPETRPDSNDNQTIVHGLDDPTVFASEMKRAGFTEITIEPIRHSFQYPGPRGCWESMVKGSAPVTFMKSRTPAKEWAEKERIAIEWLRTNIDPETRSLHSTAYLGYGIKPAESSAT